jgi:hypothetical protein
MSKKTVKKPKPVAKGTGHRHAPSIFATPSNKPVMDSQTKFYGATEVTVDKEFERLLGIRPDADITALESLVVKDGIEKPLDVWSKDGKLIIIDGYTRLRIAIKHGLKFRVKLWEFTSREEVKIWIITQQIARRNIGAIRKLYLIGYEYDTLKKDRSQNLLQYLLPKDHHDTSAEGIDNQMVEQKRDNETFPKYHSDTSETSDTAERLAAKHNKGRATVLRAHNIYRALVEIKKSSEKFQDEILDERVEVTAKDLEAYAKLEPMPHVVDRATLKAALAGGSTKPPKKEKRNDLDSPWKKAAGVYKKALASPTNKNRAEAAERLKNFRAQLDEAIQKLEATVE